MANSEKKRKWEREYEDYQNSTGLDERIEELEKKIKAAHPRKRTVAFEDGKKASVDKDFKYDIRQTSKEEYDEYKKLTAIKTNLLKVKNILELREQLEAQRKEINAEIRLREMIEQKEKENQELEAKMAREFDNIIKQNEELVKLLKSGKLSERQQEVAKFKIKENEGKLKENEPKRQENNKIFGDNLEEISKLKKQLNEKFKDISNDDLRNQATKISTNISKCNLACNKLMQGYSWQSVEVALDKFDEKLTAQGPNAAKMKQNREVAKAENSKSEQLKMNFGHQKENSEKDSDVKETPSNSNAEKEPKSKQQEKALEVPTRWQKIKKWAKGLFEKWFFEEEKSKNEEAKKKSLITRLKEAFNKFKEKEEPAKIVAESQTEELTQTEEPTQTDELTKTEEIDNFRQYLRDIAAKGIDGVEQEKLEAERAEKEARRKAAIEKLNANRAGKDTGAIITKLDKETHAQNDDGRE